MATPTPEPGAVEPAPDEAATRPLRRDAERNRQRILDAALELLAEQGLALGLNDVAHRAGVGVGTVYRHFPDKDELVDAALAGPLESYVDLVEQCLTIEDPWQSLVQMTTQGLAAHIANRGLRDAALGAGKGVHQTAVAERILQLVDSLIDRAHRSGALRDDVTAADLLLMHFMVTELADHSSDVRPDAYQRYLTLLLDGLRARPDAPDLDPPMSAAEAEAVGERLRLAVQAACRNPLDGSLVTISVGCAVARAGEPPRAALRDADAALYRAKRGGRNRVEGAEAALDDRAVA